MARKDAVERAQEAAASAWVDGFSYYLAKLQSPIEEAMFWGLMSHLMDVAGGYPPPSHEIRPYLPEGSGGVLHALCADRGERIVVIPQAKEGRFSIDLAVIAFGSWHLQPGETTQDQVIRVAVECDGHDFHERTKEQAEHDKARDRDMQAAGWVVARFTGSEINRDPVLAAGKVIRLIWNVLDRRQGR